MMTDQQIDNNNYSLDRRIIDNFCQVINYDKSYLIVKNCFSNLSKKVSRS